MAQDHQSPPPPAQDEPPKQGQASFTPITDAALRAFVARTDTRARAARIIRRRIHHQDVSDFVNDAVVEALSARRRPAAENVQAWFDQLCRFVIASHYRKRARRKKYEGPMPVAAARRDEAGAAIEDDDDPLDDVDPRSDPERDREFHADAFLARSWLDQKTAADPVERQTFAIMCEWADGEKTYADLAAEHGLTLSTVNQRVAALKKKYANELQRHREGMIVLWLLGGGAAIVIALVVAYFLQRPEDIRPDPGFVPVRPVPSASAAPTDTPFEPAEPTQPAVDAGPSGPDKPLKPTKPQR